MNTTMDQSESMEVDASKDTTTEPEEQTQHTDKAPDDTSDSQEKPVNDGGEAEASVSQTDVQDSNVIEWDEPNGDSSEVKKGTTGKEQSGVDSSEQCETPPSNMGVVILDDEFFSQSDILDIEKSVSGEQGNETDSQGQEDESDDQTNPLAASNDQENTDKQQCESDMLEIISVSGVEKSNQPETSSASETTKENSNSSGKIFDKSVPDMLEIISVTSSVEKSGNAETGSTSKTKENSSSLEKQSDESVAMNVVEEPENVIEVEQPAVQKKVVESNVSKMDDNEEIVELPVHKEPAVLVDLANEDESVSKKQRKKSQNQNFIDEAASNEGKKIKLRSLASLVDISGGEDVPTNSIVSTSHPDVPGIGEIVEHGVIIGSDEMDGLQLRISNVVGGEDCITGLTVDEDRDSFPSIQISSVTTLINPISPEDPNQNGDGIDKPSADEVSEKDGVDGVDSTLDSTTEPQTSSSGTVSADGKKSIESNEGSAEEAGKSSNESTSTKIRLSSAVTVSTF